jgi:hypothetical protein
MIRQIGSQHRRTTEHCMDPTEVIDRPSQNIAASRWATSQVGVRLRRLKVGSTVVPGSDPGGQQLWGHRLASMSAIEQVAWYLRDHVFVSETVLSEIQTWSRRYCAPTRETLALPPAAPHGCCSLLSAPSPARTTDDGRQRLS